MNNGIVSLDAGETAAAAARKMAEKGMGCLLVMQKRGIAGIVTERDLVSKVLAIGKDPHNVKLESIISQPVVTVDPETQIADATKLMSEKGIRRLPVMGKGSLVGIVTTTDVARYLAKAYL